MSTSSDEGSGSTSIPTKDALKGPAGEAELIQPETQDQELKSGSNDDKGENEKEDTEGENDHHYRNDDGEPSAYGQTISVPEPSLIPEKTKGEEETTTNEETRRQSTKVKATRHTVRGTGTKSDDVDDIPATGTTDDEQWGELLPELYAQETNEETTTMGSTSATSRGERPNQTNGGLARHIYPLDSSGGRWPTSRSTPGYSSVQTPRDVRRSRGPPRDPGASINLSNVWRETEYDSHGSSEAEMKSEMYDLMGQHAKATEERLSSWAKATEEQIQSEMQGIHGRLRDSEERQASEIHHLGDAMQQMIERMQSGTQLMVGRMMEQFLESNYADQIRDQEGTGPRDAARLGNKHRRSTIDERDRIGKEKDTAVLSTQNVKQHTKQRRIEVVNQSKLDQVRTTTLGSSKDIHDTGLLEEGGAERNRRTRSTGGNQSSSKDKTEEAAKVQDANKGATVKRLLRNGKPAVKRMEGDHVGGSRFVRSTQSGDHNGSQYEKDSFISENDEIVDRRECHRCGTKVAFGKDQESAECRECGERVFRPVYEGETHEEAKAGTKTNGPPGPPSSSSNSSRNSNRGSGHSHGPPSEGPPSSNGGSHDSSNSSRSLGSSSTGEQSETPSKAAVAATPAQPTTSGRTTTTQVAKQVKQKLWVHKMFQKGEFLNKESKAVKGMWTVNVIMYGTQLCAEIVLRGMESSCEYNLFNATDNGHKGIGDTLERFMNNLDPNWAVEMLMVRKELEIINKRAGGGPFSSTEQIMGTEEKPSPVRIRLKNYLKKNDAVVWRQQAQKGQGQNDRGSYRAFVANTEQVLLDKQSSDGTWNLYSKEEKEEREKQVETAIGLVSGLAQSLVRRCEVFPLKAASDPELKNNTAEQKASIVELSINRILSQFRLVLMANQSDDLAFKNNQYSTKEFDAPEDRGKSALWRLKKCVRLIEEREHNLMMIFFASTKRNETKQSAATNSQTKAAAATVNNVTGWRQVTRKRSKKVTKHPWQSHKTVNYSNEQEKRQRSNFTRNQPLTKLAEDLSGSKSKYPGVHLLDGGTPTEWAATVSMANTGQMWALMSAGDNRTLEQSLTDVGLLGKNQGEKFLSHAARLSEEGVLDGIRQGFIDSISPAQGSEASLYYKMHPTELVPTTEKCGRSTFMDSLQKKSNGHPLFIDKWSLLTPAMAKAIQEEHQRLRSGKSRFTNANKEGVRSKMMSHQRNLDRKSTSNAATAPSSNWRGTQPSAPPASRATYRTNIRDQICRDYQNYGSCEWGPRCRRKHVTGGQQQQQQQQQGPATVNTVQQQQGTQQFPSQSQMYNQHQVNNLMDQQVQQRQVAEERQELAKQLQEVLQLQKQFKEAGLLLDATQSA